MKRLSEITTKISFAKDALASNLTAVQLRANSFYVATEYPLLDNHLNGFIKFPERYLLSSYVPILPFYNKNNAKFTYRYAKNYIYKVILKNDAIIGALKDDFSSTKFYSIHKSDIKEFKLIGSKFWFDENEDVKNKSEVILSDDAQKHLANYVNHYGQNLVDLDEFKNLKVKNEIKVYRGIQFDNLGTIFEIFKNIKIFDNKIFNFGKATSWTTNLAVADNFAFNANTELLSKRYSVILMTKANKHNSIIDLRQLNFKLNDIALAEEEFEIILKAIPLNCKIVHIAYNNESIKQIT